MEFMQDLSVTLIVLAVIAVMPAAHTFPVWLFARRKGMAGKNRSWFLPVVNFYLAASLGDMQIFKLLLALLMLFSGQWIGVALGGGIGWIGDFISLAGLGWYIKLFYSWHVVIGELAGISARWFAFCAWIIPFSLYFVCQVLSEIGYIATERAEMMLGLIYLAQWTILLVLALRTPKVQLVTVN